MTFVTLNNVQLEGGEETPRFSATLVIRGREIAIVRNHGTGGCCTYWWNEPCNHKWAAEKLFPIAVKAAVEKYPEYETLYKKSPSEALDSLVMDALYDYEESRNSTKGKDWISKGAIVRFGRPSGEKTLGKVVKVNRKSVVIVSLEDRGSRSKMGAKWKVAPSFLEQPSPEEIARLSQ